MARPLVSMKQCTAYDEILLRNTMEDMLDRLGGLRSIVKAGDKVFLKVNLTGPYAPEQAATTHPAIVKVLVQMIKELKAYPVIGDGPATVSSPLDITGISKVADEEHVRAFLFSEHKEIGVENPLIVSSIKYSRDLLETDKIINIPKLKTHALTMFTGAMKNMFGAVEFSQRKSLHQYRSSDDFAKVIADVFSIRQPDLNIMDGILAMEGIGPVHGKPVQLGYLLASRDAVALDVIASSLLSYNPGDIPMFRYAAEKRLGVANRDEILVSGEHDFANTGRSFEKIPALSGVIRDRFLNIVMGSVICSKDKCSRCGDCKSGCPANAIRMDPYPLIDAHLCLHCFRCYEVCCQGAISIKLKRGKTL